MPVVGDMESIGIGGDTIELTVVVEARGTLAALDISLGNQGKHPITRL